MVGDIDFLMGVAKAQRGQMTQRYLTSVKRIGQAFSAFMNFVKSELEFLHKRLESGNYQQMLEPIEVATDAAIGNIGALGDFAGVGLPVLLTSMMMKPLHRMLLWF